MVLLAMRRLITAFLQPSFCLVLKLEIMLEQPDLTPVTVFLIYFQSITSKSIPDVVVYGWCDGL